MDRALNNLSVWAEKKGFFKEEVQYFIKDFKELIDREEPTSLDLLNRELEDLGWGIQILDEIAYRNMLFLYQDQ